MNYIHVSFIRNVMNAESRSKGLSASVLLKEPVSKNFRYCCVQPQCTAPGDHAGFRPRIRGFCHRQLGEYRKQRRRKGSSKSNFRVLQTFLETKLASEILQLLIPGEEICHI